MSPEPSTQVLLQYFNEQHKLATGLPYLIVYGKDHKTMKEITKVYSIQDTIKMIDLFFIQLNKDEFLKQTGASVGVFKTQLPKLVLELSNAKDRPKNEDGKGVL